ncbi:peptidase C14 caspase catalytic subunit p20 [Aureimonas leprariae]|uniref:Peptidase C14 caspase catalytic subunit p20 n=2 Tax=Plantimonas leprariae TaxID=2615207 RepID=A0A7V7TWK1_9HYPH|nr:peptidase C14 caspase catalytic subunit p20 [Aureimonas leprariae]
MEREIAERGSGVPAASPPDVVTIAKAKAALAQLGYYSGPEDGRSDPAFVAALAAWASDRDWTAPDTLRKAHVTDMEGEVGRLAASGVTLVGTGWAADRRSSGSTVCTGNRSGEATCLHLACGPEGGLALEFDPSDGDGPIPAKARLAADDGAGTDVPLEGRPGRVILTGKGSQPVLERLSKGRVLHVRVADVAVAFTLAGFGPERRRMEARCDAPSPKPASGEGGFAGRAARLPDELVDRSRLVDAEKWAYLDDTDLGGADIRGGLTDPSLRGIDEADCLAMCRETVGCRAFTFNRNGRVCFLKSEKGRDKTFPGARSGVLQTRSLAVPPPTRGPEPVVDANVGWRDADRLAPFQARVRQSARKLGNACEAERATLRSLAGALEWTLSKTSGFRVGEQASLQWSNNELADRIPVWLVLEADQPVRFAGKGSFALGPDAPNPFAIGTGLGHTRALVALATRGAGSQGSVKFAPLRSGPLDVSVSLVGYLRACEEELTLKATRETLDVAPAPAEIVLNTAEARTAFTLGIDVPAVSRRILLNDRRFLLLDATTGTEIAERAGTELRVSPTHRFVAVDNDGRTEIVDTIDGRTTATLNAGKLYWALGDSVVVTTRAPWAKVDVASTFGDHLRLAEQLTGAACCLAEPGETRISIDLENSTYAILGELGYRIGSLQNADFASVENSGGGYLSNGGGTAASHLRTLATLGMVSPVSLSRDFDAAGGFVDGEATDAVDTSGSEVPHPPAFEDRLRGSLAKVGLTVKTLGDTEQMAGDLRLADTVNSVPLSRALPEQLLRLGVTLDPMADGDVLLEPETKGETDHTHAMELPARLERSAPAMGRLEREAKAAGWRFRWSLPEEDDGLLADCGHVLLGDAGDTGNVGESFGPRDVVEVSRVATRRGAVWVARASCTAGATFGSLRPHAAFYVMDIGSAKSMKGSDAMVDGSEFFENNAHRLWYDHPFRIKANDDLLLTYAPGNGVITVRQRATRSMLWIGENLPNGDLLVDAWLTGDRRHAVQLNSDGNFYVHDLMKAGAVILSGRIVDDEVAVWTSDFRYDATAEAAALIDLKFPGRDEQFSLDRFGAALRVPDLTRAALEGSVPSAKEGDLGVPPSLAGEIALDSDGKVRANLRYEAGEVVRLSVLQDGVSTGTFESDRLNGTVTFERLKDTRLVSIVAFDARGLASLPVSVDLGPSPTRRATTRVLSIGVNTYQGAGLRSLNYALRDAGRVQELLSVRNDGEPPFAVETAPKDRRASPDAIVEATRRLLDGLEPGDHAVIFLAGHGLQDAKGRFYFGTSLTDPADLEGTALAFERLERLFQSTDARITIFLDACHSGAAGTGAFATNDDLAGNFARSRSNVTVLAAAKGRQESEGSREVGGLFTDAIAAVLGAERDRYDRNRNGRIEASELYRGVKARVVRASGGRQTPWMVGSRMVGDYALF